MFLYIYGTKQKPTKATPYVRQRLNYRDFLQIGWILEDIFTLFTQMHRTDRLKKETLPSWWQNVGAWDHVDYDSVPFFWLPMSQAFIPQRRIRHHKVFAGFAERGCCSMGWFYGFKLHLICNERGELLSFAFTKGNIDDRKPLEDK